MPIPSPSKGQSKKSFIAECSGDKIMNEEYPDVKQRVAVCYSRWETRRKTAKAIITVDDDEIAIFEEDSNA